jgi:hypothetical protein
MKKIFSCSALALILFGCAASLETIRPTQFAPPEQQYRPAIEVKHEALLGDVMVSKIEGIPTKGFIATDNYQPAAITIAGTGTFHYALIARDSEWAIIGTMDNGDMVCKNSSYPEPILNNAETKGNTVLLVNKQNEPYGFADYAAGQVNPRLWANRPANLLKKADKVFLRGSRKQELLYNGKSQNNIKLSYREYNNDFTCPAITQDLTYDLVESKAIGFRGMKIDVLEATNLSIKFIVRSPMN